MRGIRRLSVCIVVLWLAGFVVAAQPIQNNGVPWRLAYYEGGPWVDYQGELIALVDSLVDLDWISPFEWPELTSSDDVAFLWLWLANNIKSDFIAFVPDAFWSANWQSDLRAQNRESAIHRLAEISDIDLILALGTWAGLDLANSLHSTPTLVMSTNNPIQAGIIDSAKDSGFDHVHARTDPERFVRQITAFHNLVQFRRLGIVFEDAPSL